ncbi:MAG: glycosyltransferase [Planctomycetaceae bacterium]
MRRVLMVSPHFPPDTTAASHRVRLLAPHLPAFGWEPTVLAVDPRDYEGRLDPELAELVPESLRVVRSRAWSTRWTRKLKVGDLGLRAFTNLWRASRRLLRDEKFDAFYVTVFPMYPALLGPLVRRRFDVPFVLDYIDPWVGASGLTVGNGLGGSVDLKSRLSRRLGVTLEPIAIRAADALTAVSAATYEQILDRNPKRRGVPCVEIPYGGEAADFDRLRNRPRSNPYFDPQDGLCHICYVGTLLPLGFETLRAVLKALRLLRDVRPAVYDKVRLHFFGTSNQTLGKTPLRVLPVAAEIGVADRVTEIAPRIDYLDALTVQTQATAILMMGSSERHYTASKLYPGLLSRRPLLAVYHEASTVVKYLRESTSPPTVRVIAYGDVQRAEDCVGEIAGHLGSLIENPQYDASAVKLDRLEAFSAKSLAGRLAECLDQAVKGSHANGR